MKNQILKLWAIPFLIGVALLCGVGAADASDGVGVKQALSADEALTIEGEDIAVPSDATGSTSALYVYDGKITMTGGSLTSAAHTSSFGAATAYHNGEIDLNDVDVLTKNVDGENVDGFHRYGVYLNGGTIRMNGGSITTEQYNSLGAYSYGNGHMELNDVAIETFGTFAWGVYVSTGAHLDITGGSIVTHGSPTEEQAQTMVGGNEGYPANAAAIARNWGKMTLNGVQIKTDGDCDSGAVVESTDSRIDIEDVSITTQGAVSHGVIAQSEGTMSFSDGTIATSGYGSHGGYSFTGASLDVQNSTISTTGARSAGLMAEAAALSADHLSVRTTGESGIGIWAAGNGDSQKLTDAYGMARIHLSDVDIKTEGEGAYGILAEDGTNVTLEKSADITVNNTAALLSIGSSVIDAQDGVYQITGDIAAQDDSTTGVSFTGNSLFTGAAEAVDNGKVNLKMADNARWNVTGNSKVTSLAMDGSDTAVDMTQAPLGSLLVADSLSGNGNFTMKTDIAAQSADEILSRTTDGSHKITVANQGDAAVTGDERVTLVETLDKGGDFALTNKVELGAFQYDLRKNNDGKGQFDTTGGQYWELFGAVKSDDTGPSGPGDPTDPGDKPDPSNPGSAAINTFVANYLLNYAETGTLMKRLGDLRDTPYRDGAWFRAYGGKFSDFEREYVRDFDMDYGGVQVGYDHRLENSSFKNGETYVGAFIGTSNGDLDFKQYGAGSGSVENRTMGMYATYVGNNGFYVDSVAKYVWSKNKYEVLDSANELVTGDTINTGGVGMSIEAGKRIPFGQKSKNNGQWYVEPQVQLSWQHQDGGSFHASNGLEIGIDGYDSLLGRAGVLIGYQADRTNFYAKASYVKEFNGDLNITANGVDISESMEDNWLVYGVGLTRQMNDRNSIYLDAERSSDGDFEQEWALNAGWRISF